MKKMVIFLDKIPISFLKQRHFEPSTLSVSVYSTQTLPGTSDTLYHRLQRCNEHRVSVIPILNQWIAEGGALHHRELKRFIINFRKNGRFKSALEIVEWMSHSMKHLAITPRHVAVQLDLVSKVHGLEQAENYFNSIEASLMDLPVYGALLNCYADAKSLEKAEATMKKIRKMNGLSSLTYNTMLSLYSQMRMHDKLHSLMQEMEDKGIGFSEVTYNIILNAYAGSDGMEKLLMKMEVDPTVTVDYCSYATAAKGYIRVGALQKASMALKKAEHLIKGQKEKYVYGILISLYAAMQKREDVFRLWELLSKHGKVYYHCYVHMITSLEKLDDLDSAKKILEEWEEKNMNTNFDIRIPNLVISAYCKRGMVEEADIILQRLIETGKEPSAKTWSHMAFGYCKIHQMDKAVEMTKKSFTATFPGWKPDLNTVAACIEYLKERGDIDEIQEIFTLLEKYGSFSADFKERMRRYLNNAELRPEALERRNVSDV